ncbi:response regulator [Paenibacillus sinopodophylli]|uniref:response regulator n=1 Tax=Paenibacillus sinopodophylli TaxID=1837342 RepID=UPI00110C8F2C|nr:response regulator [Paenibacillus sinopodophylli]
MFRLLIVDDEEYITDGLYEVISGLDEPELDVCKAYSASEALEWLGRTRIDIVLTDIRMPDMDGLELFERIKAHWPRCRTIFLTGYPEFGYVYHAIQSPGVSYLLKTEGYDKLIAKITETVRELDESLRMTDLQQRSQELEEKLESHLHGDYFRDLLTGKVPITNLAFEFEEMGLQLDPDKPILMTICQILDTDVDSLHAARKDSLSSVCYLTDSFLSDQLRSTCVTDWRGNLVWFIQPLRLDEEYTDKEPIEIGRFVQGTLELIQKACTESLGLSVAFAINESMRPWEELVSCYERLQQLLWLQIGDGVSMIVTDHSDDEEGDPRPFSQDRTPIQKAELLIGYLESGRKPQFEALLEQWEQELLAANVDSMQALESYYAITLALLSHINRWRPTNIKIEFGRLIRFDDHATRSEAMAYAKETARMLFMARHTEERRRAGDIIDRVQAYIEDHLSGDLSLVRLSELVHFNPAYLSRLFKQECGVNLSTYIEDIRLRKAKDLLERGEDKIHEVGALVGYETAHSFTRFFKKAIGVTPQEFRKALSKK